MDLERWDRARSSDLAAVVDAALPGEGLTEDELVAVAWEDVDPTVVVGTPDDAGVAAGVVHGDTAFVQLVAVRPEARRQGLGRALVESVGRWAREEHGATTLSVGGCAPFYLWPGVDVHATPALCLFEALGVRARGAELNLSFPSSHRAPPPAGVELRRALDETDVAAGLAFVERHWPDWVPETRRGIEHGACHLAWSTAGDVVGFGCHSVNRFGWLGPMGTDPERRSTGTGSALLGAIASDLMAAGLSTVEVAWIGPVRFYAKAAGATVARAYRTFSRGAEASA
ncbi:MAG TPA: GNAT family N-acetyltransferase [Acidimicrobiales bacterium]|nr:GNAT family N-acetyltransferase [Acidimicrobiales bacterium]